MAEIAPLRIVYIFEDGAESDIALGTIAQDGMLEITKVADGQAAAVGTLVSELNAAERMFLRDARTSPETGRAALTKTPVDRGAPEFMEALRETARRYYSVDLRFDPAVFAGGELLMQDGDDEPGDDQIDDTPPEPDMTPVEGAKPGIEV
jgi:hypothetical protein